MKDHIWNLASYVLFLVLVCWQYSAEIDAVGIAMTTLLLIGFMHFIITVVSIAWGSLVWFWDATVNYSKNRRDKIDDEI